MDIQTSWQPFPLITSSLTVWSMQTATGSAQLAGLRLKSPVMTAPLYEPRTPARRWDHGCSPHQGLGPANMKKGRSSSSIWFTWSMNCPRTICGSFSTALTGSSQPRNGQKILRIRYQNLKDASRSKYIRWKNVRHMILGISACPASTMSSSAPASQVKGNFSNNWRMKKLKICARTLN